MWTLLTVSFASQTPTVAWAHPHIAYLWHTVCLYLPQTRTCFNIGNTGCKWDGENTSEEFIIYTSSQISEQIQALEAQIFYKSIIIIVDIKSGVRMCGLTFHSAVSFLPKYIWTNSKYNSDEQISLEIANPFKNQKWHWILQWLPFLSILFFFLGLGFSRSFEHFNMNDTI